MLCNRSGKLNALNKIIALEKRVPRPCCWRWKHITNWTSTPYCISATSESCVVGFWVFEKKKKKKPGSLIPQYCTPIHKSANPTNQSLTSRLLFSLYIYNLLFTWMCTHTVQKNTAALLFSWPFFKLFCHLFEKKKKEKKKEVAFFSVGAWLRCVRLWSWCI